MASNNEVNRLRQELKKRRAAVTNKIGRMKREQNANVAGTEFDPRRPLGSEKRYNKAQLQRHLAELNAFMDRSVQFKGGADGPIKRGTYNVMKRLADQILDAQTSHAERIDILEAPLMGDIRPGEKGMTVGQRRNMLHPQADGGVKGPYSGIDLDISSVANEKAALKLIDDMRRQLKSSFLSSKLQQGKNQLNKALVIMGEAELADRIDNLSESSFDALWYGQAFAELTFMKYDIEQSRLEGTSKERWQDRMVDNAWEDADKYITWAEELDKAGPDEETGEVIGIKR